MTEFPISAYEADWPAGDVERDLIERARHDREAFAQLYRRHYAPIAAYVHRRVGDTHASEDLVAEVFIAAMRSIRRYRHRGLPFRSWLYRIATNAVNRWVRKQRRAAWLGGWPIHRTERGGFSMIAPATREEPEPSQATGGRDAVRLDGEVERARREMLTLSPHHQAVLALHYFEGLPLEDVAAICGCRLGTVKSRLARGRESLRVRLEQGR